MWHSAIKAAVAAALGTLWDKVGGMIFRRRSAEEQWRDLQREIDNRDDENAAKERMDSVERPSVSDIDSILRDPDQRI